MTILSKKHAWMAGTALACGLAVSHAAFAQSSGSTAAESTDNSVSELVVKVRKPSTADGLAVPVLAAKDESVVTKDYIQDQVGSSNFAQLINLLPGVSYSTEDPTGILSSDFRMHGFDGAHVSFTFDGAPLNDTGNYAIFPGEYLPDEVLDHITVNMGQTEVDSPTASAIGGTVNMTTKLPDEAFSANASISGGSNSYRRFYGEVDSGAVGPTGLRSFLSVNIADAEKYKGEGNLAKYGIDGRIYQPLKDQDFLSLAFTYAQDRTYFYESDSLAKFAQFGNSVDYNTQWQVPTVNGAAADGVGGPSSPTAPGFLQGSNSNFWKLHPNPVNFGILRGGSRFTLAPKLILTMDPYFFYTLANGGGTTSLKETDPRLTGGGAAHACTGQGTASSGFDLNGDGDCRDTILVYSPSDTQTHRYGLNTSLLYDLNDNNRFQFAYSLDYGRHSQTGFFTPIDQATGTPDNLFGGLHGFGPQILDETGAPLTTRNRFSIAKLNQFAVNWVGKFDQDKLRFNVGIRDPHFERDLDQKCDTYNGSTVVCTSVTQAAVATALATDTASHDPNVTALNKLLFDGAKTIAFNAQTGAPNFRLPFQQDYKFTHVLPNAGVAYDIDDHQGVYATYAMGFSSPKTDDLYVSSPELVQPETTNTFGAGYRYFNQGITLSANLWGSTWANHIVQSIDPNDPTLSIDRNVGSVDLYGLDLEGGWRADDHFTLYASAALEKSKLMDGYSVKATDGATVLLPVKGKELVLTPDETFSLRGQYTLGEYVIGLEGKYTSKRYVSDVNDQSMPGYTTANLDLAYKFVAGRQKMTLLLNIDNVFGQNYLSRVSTVQNAKAVVVNGHTISAASGPFYYVGAPTTGYITLKAAF
jgi:iron complex outermembrane receptor protein